MRLRRLSSSALVLSVLLLFLLCTCSRAQSNNNIRFASPPEAPSLRGGVGNSGVDAADAALPLRPPPHKPLRVVARLAALTESSPKPNVSLTYIVGFGTPTTILMEPLPMEGGKERNATLPFEAEIPAETLSAGSLVRWAATAAVPSSSSSSVRCPKRADDWLGTVVLDPGEPPSKLPMLEWFRNSSENWLFFEGTLRPLASLSRKGTTSRGWPKMKLKLEFKKGYDVESNGGGDDKLALRRPFVIAADDDAEDGKGRGGASTSMAPSTTSTTKTPSAVDLDSLWWEPGSNSYVRQAAAFAALRRVSGAPALLTRHVVVRRDGAFYGLHALVERAGASWLRREGLMDNGGEEGTEGEDNGFTSSSTDVSLYKPITASAALAPNVPLQLLPLVWKTEHGETRHADIDDFTRKLANGRLRRSSSGGGRGGDDGREAAAAQWLLDALDLPRTLSYLATAAVLLQQDRCTKNHYLLQERERENNGGLSSRWSLLAGDSKTAFGSDSGFNGEKEHARDYALNHADQFASPLFCDRGHPQDVEGRSVEPWSSVVVDPITRRRRRGERRRRLLLRRQLEAETTTRTTASPSPSPQPSSSSPVAPRIEQPPASRPADPRPLLGCSADTTSLVAFDGSPPSTFNAVVDALLRCPPTREMFLRRVRTLTEQLHGRVGGAGNETENGGGGALYPIVSRLAASVAADAARDDALWRGGDPSLGARQLLEEQIPGRGKQLAEAYGEGGYLVPGLLPEGQPAVLPASAVRVVVLRGNDVRSSRSSSPSSSSSSSPSDQIIAAISSTSSSSLDLSNYSLRIGKSKVAFPAGTVTPPSGGWVVVAGGRGRKGFLRLTPAVGSRLAREAGLQGLIMSVQGEQRELKEDAPAEAVSLVAPVGEAVVIS